MEGQPIKLYRRVDISDTFHPREGQEGQIFTAIKVKEGLYGTPGSPNVERRSTYSRIGCTVITFPFSLITNSTLSLEIVDLGSENVLKTS